MEYTVFNSDTIKAQFNQIRMELTTEMLPDEIMERFRKILVNRAVIALTYDENSPSITLYRVTKKFEGFDENIKSSYSYPPNPSQGRANLEGKPVLYTSLDPVGAVAEMKDTIALGEKFYISKWQINFDKKVIAHWLIVNSTTASSDEVIGEISKEQKEKLRNAVANIPDEFQEGFVLSIEQLGDLYSTEGNSLYHITSAYSHDVMFNSRAQNVFIDMLVYPSVENKQSSVNIAIHPDLVNSNQMRLEEVYEVSMKENTLKTDEDGGIKMDVYKQGIFGENDSPKWGFPTFAITNIDFDNLELFTYNKTLLKGEEAFLKKINNGEISVKDWLTQAIKSEQIMNEAFESIELDTLNSPLEKIRFVQDLQMLTEIEHGNEIDTPSGRSCIYRVKLPFKVHMEYKSRTI